MKTKPEPKPETWYSAKTGNDQGLIISAKDGRNIAVAYDKADAPLIARAPDMEQALRLCVKALADYTDGPEHEQAALDAARAALGD